MISPLIYHKNIPNETFIDLDHTSDLSNCIFDNDYTLTYELEVLPPKNLAELFMADANDWIENEKWFMDQLLIGANRHLMNDFIKVSNYTKTFGSSSFCFVISLGQEGESTEELDDESNNPFKLSLQKYGAVIINNFYLPNVKEIIEIESGIHEMKFDIVHDKPNAFSDNSIAHNFKYVIVTIEEEFDNYVCIL